jgi:hypothetical protein
MLGVGLKYCCSKYKVIKSKTVELNSCLDSRLLAAVLPLYEYPGFKNIKLEPSDSLKRKTKLQLLKSLIF